MANKAKGIHRLNFMILRNLPKIAGSTIITLKIIYVLWGLPYHKTKWSEFKLPSAVSSIFSRY